MLWPLPLRSGGGGCTDERATGFWNFGQWRLCDWKAPPVFNPCAQLHRGVYGGLRGKLDHAESHPFCDS